ncbi:MAG: hypothetical protein R3B07_31850 [Polyangiaceae bacterium]
MRPPAFSSPFRAVFRLGLGLCALSLTTAACRDDQAARQSAASSALDCAAGTPTSAGRLEGRELNGDTALLAAAKGPDGWFLSGLIDDYQVNAWCDSSLAPDLARAHITAGSGEQLCVDTLSWGNDVKFFDPEAPSISFSGLSTLGSCADVQGPTSTLHFCESLADAEELPEGCIPRATHLWGEVNDVDFEEEEQRGLGTSYSSGNADSVDTYFTGGGRLFLQRHPPTANPGFLRLERDGAMTVYCVRRYRDESPNDERVLRLSLEVTELGSCPGATLAGEVAACFF